MGPKSFDHFARDGKLAAERRWSYPGQPQIVHVGRRVYPSDIFVGDGLPAVKTVVAHADFVTQVPGQQGVFLGGKDVRTNVDRGVCLIDVVYFSHGGWSCSPR
jgi:hypothetical protein